MRATTSSRSVVTVASSTKSGPPKGSKKSGTAASLSRSVLAAAPPAEDVVDLIDVLSSMAESVMHKQTCFEVPFKPDADATFKPARPPREIFYRNTTLFITEVPPPPAPKRCNCHINCPPPGNVATYRCLSCGLFDSTGMCLFCDRCFRYTHPWHRAPHIFTRIEDDELIEETMQKANRLAEVSRRELEGEEMVRHMQRVRRTFETLGDDEEVEDKMLAVGRRSVALEERLHRLRGDLQRDIRASSGQSNGQAAKHAKQLVLEQGWAAAEGGLKERRRQEAEARRLAATATDGDGDVGPATGDVSAPVSGLLSGGDSWVRSGEHTHPPATATATAPAPAQVAAAAARPSPSQQYLRWARALAPRPAHAAAARLQAICRGHLTRRVLSSHFAARTVRVFDPTAGRDYFYDTETGQSSWQPPVLLTRADRERLSYRMGEAVVQQWYLKVGIPRRRPQPIASRVQAAAVVQGFVRCVLARRRAVARACQVYRRIHDEEYDAHFYWHATTKRSVWAKPRLFLSQEPPLYVPDDGSLTTSVATGTTHTSLGDVTASVATYSSGATYKAKIDPRRNRDRIAPLLAQIGIKL